VKKFVFSSTCATYGVPQTLPITEIMPQAPINPYGQTKLDMENVLKAVAHAHGLSFAAFRYFNAAGAAADAQIGEDHDPETHLIPVILQAVMGLKPELTVFGTDYPTPDGTNVRDYIHVEDLADAHILAMGKLAPGKSIQCNLGTGRGFSVREIIKTAEKVTGKAVPVKWGPRRAGDAIALYANPAKAKEVLGWEAKHKDPQTIIASAWKWFQAHPKGY
jgi:UDP-glucose 4-epimerase